MTLKLVKKKKWGLAEVASREQVLIAVIFERLSNGLSKQSAITKIYL
ncbi:hypothetical protein LP109_14715 (plasmid) [Moraxella bovis]|nr:hypothetical protein [Moraxella bovis]UZA18157.1 hypothetical protein LP109_14715 [Moraxella bovis]